MPTNLNPTDPAYLRTIHDGLLLGTFHKDNASALPIGLVGMYEEALPPASNVNERKKFLDFFSVWALLRKEVSVTFLIPLLEGWSEEIIIYYLNKYSKWFNSPQSGKYVLYHERMRAFILQKISKQQFNACNETIIKVSHDALSRRSGDEWENYALEYLSNHMLIPAIEKGDGTVLKLLAYNTTHWNRQVEISKGFDWSKRMLNNMMLWASKYDDEEVIECALNKLDLHHQEQNDAPRIVELVAQNDIETVLQRIEVFGGQDKEGLQRKFILYMLCLMELTLLDSKDKPFRKEAIEKLLKHFDDNIPANQPDLINWNDFFPSYLMFQMACECSELNDNYLLVYKRTNYWNSEWLIDKRGIVDANIDTILKIANEINNHYEFVMLNCNILFCVRSNSLFDKLNKRLLVEIEKIEAWHFKNIATAKLTEVLIFYNKVELASSIVCQIESHYLQKYYSCLGQFYIENKDIIKGVKVYEEIDDELDRIISISYSALYFISIQEFSSALILIDKCVSFYSNLDEECRSEIIHIFFLALMKSRSYELAIRFAEDLIYDHEIDTAYSVIASELSNSIQLDEAEIIIHKIKSHKKRSYCYSKISKEYYLQDNHLESGKCFNLAIKEAMLMSTIDRDDYDFEFSPRCEALEDIAIEMLNVDKKYFNVLIQDIKQVKSPQESLSKIMFHSNIYNNINIIKDCLFELSSSNHLYQSVLDKIKICNQIALESIIQKKLDQTIKVLNFIQDKNEHDKVLNELIQLCINVHDFDHALILSEHFAYVVKTCDILLIIAENTYLVTGSSKALKILELAKGYIEKIDFNEGLRQDYLYKLSNAYLHLGMEKLCILVIDPMSDEFIHKERAVINLSLFYVKSNNIDAAITNIEVVGSVNKSKAIKEIAIEYSKIDPVYSLELTNLISNKLNKAEAKVKILSELKINDEYMVRNLAQECSELICEIKNDRDRGLLFQELTLFFVKKGDLSSALKNAESISVNYSNIKKDAILSIINELLNQNRYNESSLIIAKIENCIDSSYLEESYNYIALEFVKREKISDFYKIVTVLDSLNNGKSLEKLSLCLIEIKRTSESLYVANLIRNNFEKIRIYIACSKELRRQGKLNESRELINQTIDYWRLINDENKRSVAVSIISSELAILDNLKHAEKIGFAIPQIYDRHYCWISMAEEIVDERGAKLALESVKNFESDETKHFYLKAWTNHITVVDCNSGLILEAIHQLMGDIDSLETLLDKYALYKLFFNETPSEKINRFNCTLNLQWAIDIQSTLTI